MKVFKSTLAFLLVLILVVVMVACGGGDTPTSSQSAAEDVPVSEDGGSDSGPATGSDTGLSICIITSSGVDDGSFGQDCYEGILAYTEANSGATINTIKEPDMAKLVDAAAQVIADYDVLVLPGFQFSPIGSVADVNPDTKILLIDTAPTDADGAETQLDNVYSMTFQEEESGFYAGIAAALETKSNKVASVHGIAFPSNVNYQYGFASGVNYANKHYGTSAEIVELPSYAGEDVTGTNVGGNYVGNFADQATGKVVGEALIAEGCDIIFVAAGDSGNGVFVAAKEADSVYVIGVDVDQYDDGVNGESNIILTSALKGMAVNVTRQLEKIADGSFVGENALLGASTGSTGYVSEVGRQQMSDDTHSKLEEAKARLEAGEIVPASFANEYMPDDFPGL